MTSSSVAMLTTVMPWRSRTSSAARPIARAALPAVQGDDTSHRLRTRLANDLDGGVDRGPGRDHVIDDHDPASQGGPEGEPALAVVLGFLAVEAERHVAPLFRRERHGQGRGQWDPLVGRPEQHVEPDVGRAEGACIEPREPHQIASRGTPREVEEIRAGAP